MRLFDPERPQVGGRPAWLAAPQIVIPSLRITPTPDGFSVWVWWPVSGERLGTFTELPLLVSGSMSLGVVLDQWKDDPEKALAEFWGKEIGQQRLESESQIVTKTAEELGL